MDVTIYTSDHCSACKEAIRFFQAEGIPYHPLDVSHDKQNFAQMLNIGGVATPVIVVGSQIFHSFKPEEIKQALLTEQA